MEKALDKIKKIGLVEVFEIMVKFFMQREIREVLHVLFDQGVFGKESNIVLELRADDTFAEDDNEGIENL